MTKCYTGIDGCKAGWIVVTLQSKDLDFFITDSFIKILKVLDDDCQLWVDMPMGLSGDGYIRTADARLRKLLKGRTSTVFNAPARDTLYKASYEDARTTNIQVESKSLSIQSFYLIPKVKEIDELLRQQPDLKNRVFESHPELCFARLNGGKVLLSTKKSGDGIVERIDLLNKHVAHAGQFIISSISEAKSTTFTIDDITDATCLAICSKLADRDGMQKIQGSGPDAFGIDDSIVYW